MDEKAAAFEAAADDISRFVARGLDHVTGTEWLTGLATAHGLLSNSLPMTCRPSLDVIERGKRVRIVSIRARRCRKPGRTASRCVRQVLSKADFVSGFQPPDYLVEGMLQRRFVYAMTGQTGHAKTAIALRIARTGVSCADYAMLGHHRVEKGRVIYFVGENPDDVRMRVDRRQLHSAMTTRCKDTITFIPGVFNIGQMLMPSCQACDQVGGLRSGHRRHFGGLFPWRRGNEQHADGQPCPHVAAS